MREEDIEIIYKNLHLDFVNKYFKNKKQQQKIHANKVLYPEKFGFYHPANMLADKDYGNGL